MVMKKIWLGIKSWFARLFREESEDNPVLFVDANSYNCYKGEKIYYVVLSTGGSYTVDWQFAEDIYKDMSTWHLLISISLVKGLYKNRDKAYEYCFDAKQGSQKEIEKVFFSGLDINKK